MELKDNSFTIWDFFRVNTYVFNFFNFLNFFNFPTS